MTMEFYKETSFKETPIGKIPKDWEVIRIKDKFTVETGTTPSTRKKEYWLNGEINWFTPTDLSKLNERIFLESSERKITKKALEETNLTVIPKGSILVSTRAPVGYVAVLREEGAFNQGCKGLVAKTTNEICSEFYCYYLLKMKHYLQSLSGGSTFKELSKGMLERFYVPFLSFKEQLRIVEVLSVVDLAIQKTDEIIAKTERLKRGLMQTLLTKGIGHKKFKETPIGKIPKTWQVMRLKEVATVQRGKFAHRPRNDPRFYGGKIPFIQTGDIARASGIIKEYSQTLNEEGLKISKLFKKGTIVISIAGNIGDVGILGFDACFPDSVVGISVGNKINKLFLMYLLQYFKHELSGKAPRSTQKNINLQILESLKIPVPPLSEQEKIAKILFTIDKKLQIENENKKKLENIKRGLMDLLLTGKIRVRVN